MGIIRIFIKLAFVNIPRYHCIYVLYSILCLDACPLTAVDPVTTHFVFKHGRSDNYSQFTN